MNVRELIHKLKDIPPDAAVFIEEEDWPEGEVLSIDVRVKPGEDFGDGEIGRPVVILSTVTFGDTHELNDKWEYVVRVPLSPEEEQRLLDDNSDMD